MFYRQLRNKKQIEAILFRFRFIQRKQDDCYLFQSAHCTHIKSYLADHPEIQSMLADYVQMILLMKPEDVLEYTLDYFMQYIPEAFPRNEYFEQAPEEEEPYFII